MSEDAQTKQKLIESAKKDFLKNGYKNASLRRICRSADVTTGALYFFFENKKALFEAVIEKPLGEFRALFDSMVKAEFDDPKAFSETEDKMIRFLLGYRTEMIIILDRSQGTKYEDFKEKYLRTLEGIFTMFFKKFLPEPDLNLIHIITAMRFYGYLEILYGDYSEDEAVDLAQKTGIYADAGFIGLIDTLKKQ